MVSFDFNLEKKVKIASIVFAIILITFGKISNDIGVLGNTILISAVLIIGLFSIFEYKKYRELKEMEEKFPTFLRDLTETISSGVSLPKAIVLCSKYDYGSLNKEIKKMVNQISWHIPINKVLERSAKEMRKSRKMSVALRILREAYISGGNIPAVLTSLSESFEKLEEIGKERKSILNQYVVMIYAISFIFLVVIVMIQRILIPILSNPQLGYMGASNPCLNCYGAACDLCNFYRLTSFSLFNAKEENFYYISLFFYLSVIQAFFAGLVAGQISEGSYKAGLKHSIILITVIIGVFLIIYRIGIFGA
ncbi:MAG: type II secretion system F family protein [Candidatus Aenigmatarchaeota archaeon]